MNKWNLIEKKLQGGLSEHEQIMLDDLIKNDAEFATELNQHLATKELLNKYSEVIEFDNIISKLREDRKQTKGVIRIVWLSSVAASLLIFCYFSFTDVYRPDVSIDSGLVMQIEQNVKNSELKPEQKKALDNFFVGQYEMASGNFEKAIFYFNEASKITDIRQYFREAVIWHLCIANLKANKLDAAKKLIDKISSWENPKYSVSTIDKWKLQWQIYLKRLFT